MKKKRYPYFYERHKLKHVAAFLTEQELDQLKEIASAADKSVARYLTRLVQNHIREKYPPK